MAQQGDAVAPKLQAAKNVLAGAEKFEKSADPSGNLAKNYSKSTTAQKQTMAENSDRPKAMTPDQHSGSVADTNRSVAAEEGAKYGMKSMPIMHKGGVVKADGPHMLQKGEIVIPASGRQSEYREAFEERGRQGLHKYGQAAKEQTRQVGGNTPVKGEQQLKGAEKVANPVKD